MTIDKKTEKDTLIIALTGKLDTNSASELEKEITNLDNYNNIVFDLKKLDYISSSGLRVL